MLLYEIFLGTSQYADAILPAIAACVSESPPRDMAFLMVSSKLSASKKQIIASGTLPAHETSKLYHGRIWSNDLDKSYSYLTST